MTAISYMPVYNLATGEESWFKNSLPPIENLINAYMLAEKLGSNLHNEECRAKLRKSIRVGKNTAGLGDWAVKI